MALAERLKSFPDTNSRDTMRTSRLSSEAKTAAARFVLCIRNTAYPASLELRRVYPLLSDARAAKHGQVRIIDESAEDYLYPQEYFVPIKLPPAAERAVLREKYKSM